MKFEISYDKTLGVTVATIIKTLTLADMQKMSQVAVEIMVMNQCNLILCDARLSNQVPDTMELLEAAKFFSNVPISLNSKTAILASESYPGYAGLDFFQQLCTANGYRVKVFTNPDTALTWLTSNNQVNNCRPSIHF